MVLHNIYFLLMLVFVFSSCYSQIIKFDKYEKSGQTQTSVRIASVSVIPQKWDKKTNWQRIERLVRRAVVEGGADVVVTPEGALDGYVINEVNAEKAAENKQKMIEKFLSLGEPPDGVYLSKAGNLCKELGIFLVLGFLERQDERLYNSAVLIDPEGDIVGKYSKTHFAQGYEINPDCYLPGQNYPVFQTPFGRIGLLICYDRQLPEPARIIALQGAQILFLPSYGSYTEETGWNTIMLRTRAYENKLPLVFSHPFQSLLINHHGDVKAIGGAGEIVYFDLDTSPRRYEGRFKNRRPETYELLIEETDPQ